MSLDLLGIAFNERFLVKEQIGEGGWATVYEALDQEGSAKVALKVLNPSFLARRPREAGRNIRRFLREGEILKHLKGCPHVVQYVDHGESKTGEHYIAMELLEGPQLRHYMGRGASLMDARRVVTLGEHLAAGLEEIHKAGILHRDLAPDNVIITTSADNQEIPRYVDFGIGKSLSGGMDEVTQMLTIMGKPEYFSPEQARGEELTASSDLYSLGVILYEMLTGVVPIRMQGGIKSTRDLIALQKNLPTPMEEHPGGERVPMELRMMIMQCLHKTPDARPSLTALRECMTSSLPRVEAGEQFPHEHQTEVITLRPDGARRRERRPPKTFQDFREGFLFKGRYRIERLLGRGGMGSVYLAYDQVLNRETALKIHTEIHDRSARNTILQEAKASASLDRCPNIVTIYDAGSHEGVPYIAMEYVDGETLRDTIEDQSPINGDDFYHLARGIAEGLRFAHEQPMRVIHRDLKPSNVMVNAAGTPKIADFGIAKVIDKQASDDETKTLVAPAGSSALGTAATMSPEQAENRSVDERSDIYSLGCVLYWMACGSPPFTGDPISILVQHGTRPPKPPLTITPELQPKKLDRIILKCLEKNPDDRYQTAAELISSLDQTYPHLSGPASHLKKVLVGAAVATLLTAAILFFFKPFSSQNGTNPGPQFTRLARVERLPYAGGTSRLFTSSESVSLELERPADAPELVVHVQHGEETRHHRYPSDAQQIDLPLAEVVDESMEFTIWGTEGSKERFRFDLGVDKSRPEILVAVGAGADTPLDDTITTVDLRLLVFRFRDEGSGFSGQEEISVSLGDYTQPGQQIGPQNARVHVKTPTSIEIQAKDDTLNPEVREVIVRYSNPTVRLREGHPLPTVLGPVLNISVDLDHPNMNLRTTSLPGSLVLTDPSGWVSPPFQFSDGSYHLHTRLPEVTSSETRKRTLRFQYEGRDLALSNGSPALWDVVHDTTPPIMTLVAAPFGAIPEKFKQADFATRSPTRPRNIRLSESFHIQLEPPDGLPHPTSLDVMIGERRHTVPVNEDGLANLPDEEGEPKAAPLSVRIDARDQAGNASQLAFQVETLGWSVTTLSVEGAQQRQGTDGSAFRLNKADTVELRTLADGVKGRLQAYAELVDGSTNARPITTLGKSPEDEIWQASLDLSLAKPELEQRFTLSYGDTGRPQSVVLHREWFVIDSMAPRATIDYPEYGQTLPQDAPLPALPEIRLSVEDRGGLPLEGPVLPVKLRSAYRCETHATGRGAIYRLIPVKPLTPLLMEKVELQVEDLCGNVLDIELGKLRVIPPAIDVLSIQNTDSKAVWAERPPLPFDATGLSMVIRNTADSGNMHLRAWVQPDGVNPAMFSLQNLKARGTKNIVIPHPSLKTSGKLKLQWRDPRWLDQSKWIPLPSTACSYREDTKDPTWDLVLNGRSMGQVAEVRTRWDSALELVLRDPDGGLPRQAVGASPHLKAATHGTPAHGPPFREVRIPVRIPESTAGADITVVGRDMVGHTCGIHFKVIPEWPHPRLVGWGTADNRESPLVDGVHHLSPQGTQLVFLGTNRTVPFQGSIRTHNQAGEEVGTPQPITIQPHGRQTIALDTITKDARTLTVVDSNGTECATMRIALDDQAPALLLMRNGQPISTQVPLSPADLTVRVHDRTGSGLLNVLFQLESQTAPLIVDGLDPHEQHDLHLPPELALLVPASGAPLVITACDRAGNKNQTTVRLSPREIHQLGQRNWRTPNLAPLDLAPNGVLWSDKKQVRLLIETWPEGITALNWSSRAGTSGSITPASTTTDTTFDVASHREAGALTLTWVTPSQQRYPAGTFHIRHDGEDPQIRPESRHLKGQANGTLHLQVSDPSSGIREVSWEIRSDHQSETFTGDRTVSISVALPQQSGNHNLIVTARDMAGRTQFKSFVIDVSGADSQLDLTPARYPGEWAEMPTDLDSQRLQISKTEVTVKEFREFANATRSDTGFWRSLDTRLKALGRRLSIRQLKQNCHIIKQEVEQVLARNAREKPEHPVRFVTSGAAMACAAYYGGRLPTVREWRAAARGSTSEVPADNTKTCFPILKSGELNSSNIRNLRLHVWKTANGPLSVLHLGEDITSSGIVGMAGNVRELVELTDFAFRVAGGSWRAEIVDVGKISVLRANEEDIGFRIVRPR